MQPDQSTKILAVIGNPIAHSKSPLIHNAAIAKSGVNAAYFAFKVAFIENAIIAMRELNFRGYSITIPHKITAMRFVDTVDPLAQKIGAINTIVNNNGKLTGYNTDCLGAVHALASATKLAGKHVYVIGNGGAARAIVAGLVNEKAKVTVWGRDKQKAELLAREFGASGNDLTHIDANYDILINTTPIGMHPNISEMPIPADILIKRKIVFDIVYNPLETLLLKTAKKKGCKVISGTEMFLEQAYAQFELFTDKKAPKEIMRKVLLKELRKEQK